MVLSNNLAIFGWIFMSIWMVMLVLISWLFVRDGGFRQFNPAVETGIMMLFWMFGFAGCAQIFGAQRIRVTVGNRSIEVLERWPLRRRLESCAVRDVAISPVTEGKDDEGDPYFRCTLSMASGRNVTFSESHDRSLVEAARKRFMAAVV